MFCKPRDPVVCLALLCLALASCSKQQPAARKIAILPFENLSADPQLDWAGSAFSELLTAQLSGVPHIAPLSLKSLRDVPATGADAVLQGYFSEAGGGLRVEAVLQDTAANRAEKTILAAGPPNAILEIAASLARQIDPGARPLPTRNQAALRAWLEGLEGATDGFERAVAADPDFGAAYVSWAQRLASQGDRAGAKQVIASAAQRGSRIGAVERARLGVLAAALDGDGAARRRALVEMVRATPADVSLYRTLAQMDLTARSYTNAARWYEQALERDPGDAALLNEAGYAYAYARNLEAAKKALTRYRELRPREANPLDSLGDVHFYLGRFAEAEQYYLEAYAKDPAFLSGAELHKAAWARLMAGDLQGARATFDKFVQERQQQQDPLAPYRIAQWDYLTGRRRNAIERLEKAVGPPDSPLATLAAVQLSLWALESDDRDRAREFALRAHPSHPLAALCRFLSGPPATANEWAARAGEAFSQPGQHGLRRYALAYALLLSKHFQAAVPVLKEIYHQTPPSAPDPVEVLLAWALVEAGRIKEAGELLAVNPIPEIVGEHPVLWLSFPRIFQLRGIVLEKEGRPAEAKANLELFQRFSGPQQRAGQADRTPAAAMPH
ncbi:MAG: tetratricopeptide repeat protein [Rhodospirillales bacterium]